MPPSDKNIPSLAYVLTKGNNNIDLIRLLAAVAVLYGHSFALMPNPGSEDLLHKFTGIYSGEWGIKTFFFLSGLLVVNSIISSGDTTSYIVKRFVRIWPGLFFVVLGTILIIGPAVTNLPVSEYFASSGVYEYARRILTLQIWGNNSIGLPGVFEENHIKNVVNAPLWTLSVEAFAYVLILALYLIGSLSRRIALPIFLIFLLDALLPDRLVFFWLPKDNTDLAAIPFCFSVGGVLAIFKDKIKVTAAAPLGFFLLAILLRGWDKNIYLVYTFMFLFSIYLSSLNWAITLPKIPDTSYGVYLWGWPIQQTIAFFFPSIGWGWYMATTLILVFAMAYLSYRFIERPSMHLGKSILNLISKSKSSRRVA